MPTVTQTIGHGSQLLVQGTGTGAAYTPFAGVESISFSSNKIDSVETTDMGTAGSQRTYITGLEAPGDLSVKLNVIPGDPTQATLFGLKGVTSNFKVVYPGATRTRAFEGFITSVDEDIPDDKLPTLMMKMQVTGPIVNS